MNKKENKRILITIFISALLIMIIRNFKLYDYDKYFIIPVIILIGSYLYILSNNKMIIDKRGYIFLIPIILIIIGTVIFKTNISNMILNIFIIPILISNLFLSLTNKNYRISNRFVIWIYRLFPKNLFKNIKSIKDIINIKNTNKKKIYNIFLGILISIPFVFILLLLLTNADMYFNLFIDKIFKGINLLFDFDLIINNVFVFIIYFTVLFTVIINIINNKDLKDNVNDKKRNIESSIVTTLLIIINLVFVLFIVSEISKLTINFLELPKEYTYAKYAREGFFQLLFVTIINFSIILFFIYRTNIIKENKLVKNLIMTLIIFTIILIFNSYYRMILYMYEYGFTILRTQVILFLLMELIIFIILIKKIIKNLKHNDAYIFTSVIISIYVINIFLCNINVVSFINKIIGK